MSTNGVFLICSSSGSKHKLARHKRVLVSDGDSIELPSVCVLTFKQPLRVSPSVEELAQFRTDFGSGTWRLSNRVLGAGTFATVLMATNRQDIAQQMACKIINRARADSMGNVKGSWVREIEVLQLVSHVGFPAASAMWPLILPAKCDTNRKSTHH